MNTAKTKKIPIFKAYNFLIYFFVKTILKIISTIILLQFGVFVFAQNKNLVLSDFEKSKNQKIDSLIRFNTDKNKLEYLAVLPSINYNFIENSFNVGVSLSNLANFYQNKQRNKIELERLKFQLDEKKEKDIAALEQEYELIKDTYDILILELNNTALAEEIFNLKKAQYDNNKITLEEWLNVQKSTQDRVLLLLTKVKKIALKMNEFQGKIKNECYKKELDYLALKESSFVKK